MKLLLAIVALASFLALALVPSPLGSNPSFTARTETYYDAATLSTPFDASVNKPSGTQQGDILFTWIGYAGTGTIDSVPDGWTQLAINPTAYDSVLYYKIAGDSEPNSYTWSWTATNKIRIVCSAYTGGAFDADNPIDVVSNIPYTTDDVYSIAQSITVNATNSPLLFFAFVYEVTAETWTKPSIPNSDWVEDDDNGNTTSDFYTLICSMIWTGQGQTGNMSATISSTDTHKHAFAVALNPAGEPPQGTPYSFGYIIGG